MAQQCTIHWKHDLHSWIRNCGSLLPLCHSICVSVVVASKPSYVSWLGGNSASGSLTAANAASVFPCSAGSLVVGEVLWRKFFTNRCSNARVGYGPSPRSHSWNGQPVEVGLRFSSGTSLFSNPGSDMSRN